MRKMLGGISMLMVLSACSPTNALGPASPTQETAANGDSRWNSSEAVKSTAALGDGPGNYHSGQDSGSNAPWIGASVVDEAILPGERDAELAVWVDVPSNASEKHAPASVAIVIDVSGSMAGDKINNAKKAATQFIEGLSDGDIVSFLTFSDAVQTRVPAVVLDAKTRLELNSSIKQISAGGETNLFEGVRQAGLAAMNAPETHSVRRVVLISDGNATVGTMSPSALSMLGEKASEHGVQITAIGVGIDYDEKALNSLAMESSGRLYHLERPDQMAAIMTEERTLLGATRASNASVEIVPAPGVSLVSVEGARGVLSGMSMRIPLGAMFAGQHKEFMVKGRVNATSAGSRSIASVRFIFDDPSEGSLERIQESVARVEVVNDSAIASSRKNEKATGVMAMLSASRSATIAMADMSRDDFGKADEDLKEAEESLEAQAALTKDAPTKERFMNSAHQVQQARAGAAAASAAPAVAKPEASRKVQLEANHAAMDMMGF